MNQCLRHAFEPTDLHQGTRFSTAALLTAAIPPCLRTETVKAQVMEERNLPWPRKPAPAGRDGKAKERKQIVRMYGEGGEGRRPERQGAA